MSLKDINPHPRDRYISFIEHDHIYNIEGMTESAISITTFIHTFFPKFDGELMAEKVISSNNPKYIGMTKEEIVKLWADQGQDAAHQGTEMHRLIEEYINGALQPFPDEPEFKYFMNFWRHILSYRYIPFRTEWVVYDEEYNIAGCIDLVFKLPTGEYAICDWKRSKEIKKVNKYAKGFPPLSHLDDCNLNHYALQLNCYRHILEKHYGVLIIVMFLVILHPNNSDFVVITVPRIEKEVELMWETRKKVHLISNK